MIRVLLVDDEEDALDLLEILLGQIGGVEVVGRYVNPMQAIDAAAHTAVDAVLLDNQMPGMKGTEVARAIRQTSPHIPVVFTTAYAEYAVEAFEIQSTDYLLKPVTKERLQHAVDRIEQSLAASSMKAFRHTDAPFAIRCLGGFHIQSPDHSHSMTWRTKKERELCAYLVHHEGRPVNTASIIEALWPGYDLNKAKTYLYTCLSYLRKSLADYGIPIQIHKTDQGFIAACDGLTADVSAFERMLRAAVSEAHTDHRQYDRLNRLFKGEYMEACDYGWAAPRQLEIKAAYIRALRGWHAYFHSRGHAALAVDSIQRILTLAPDSEADGRELIQLHMAAGNRNEALRVYLQLEQAVRVQLGAELEEETVRLIRQSIHPAERLARGVR
ncbi:response regulator [Cohnella sp. 56]|uniref:response regulator n=1 Tax=Cohnella sp. 56 TaxID=3113722 RepID=UPI0030E96C9B